PTLKLLMKRAVQTHGPYIEGDVEYLGGGDAQVIEASSDAIPTHTPSLDRFRYLPTHAVTTEMIDRTKLMTTWNGGSKSGRRAVFNETMRRFEVAKKRAHMKLAEWLFEASDAATAGPGGTPGFHCFESAFPAN